MSGIFYSDRSAIPNRIIYYEVIQLNPDIPGNFIRSNFFNLEDAKKHAASIPDALRPSLWVHYENGEYSRLYLRPGTHRPEFF